MNAKAIENRMTVILPAMLKVQARTTAIRRGRSLSAVIRELLELWLSGAIELDDDIMPGQEVDTERD